VHNVNMKRSAICIFTCSIVAAIAVTSTESRARAASRQARDRPRGVYTEAQRKRGETVYTNACASCHGVRLSGGATVPSLAGEDFLDSWTGKTAADLFERARTSMPPASPGALTSQEYADVVAYILSRNDFPAGPAELAGDVSSLKAIPIEDSQTTRADPGAAPTRSVLDGVYAEAQSKRGTAVYAAACASCHTLTLAGKDVVPPLIGADFLDHWTGSTVGDLFQLIQSSMPQDKPGTLSAQEYADVLAYIFSRNRFPPGATDLAGDQAVLTMIRIETSRKPR
jgi:mono/diheme cytochrome c family protein